MTKEEFIEYSQYPKTLTMDGKVLWVGKYIYQTSQTLKRIFNQLKKITTKNK